MQQKINTVAFSLAQPHIEASLTYLEKATPEAINALRTYFENPGEDVTGLRLITLIDRAAALKRTYAQIEAHLKLIQGEEA